MGKSCSRCGDFKPRNEFQVRRASGDGLTAACKECLAAYDKKRANLPRRVATRLDYSKTEAGIERGNEAKRNYASNNPKKKKASEMVNNHVRDGKIIKSPCEVCGATKRIHGHHDDYSKPLSVRWLCPKHHKEWHELNGPGINGD